MTFCIQADNLHKTFALPHSRQKIRALDGLTLHIPSGALSALVGPDGAGKTTFMRTICGFLRLDSGSLKVLGCDATSDKATEAARIQANIGYMPQKFGLYEDLSLRENLELYADLHGVSQADRAERLPRLLEMTDLSPFIDRPAGKLSGGMKQKLGLACALVRSPALLLLDEPSVGVDPLSRQELWAVLLQLVKEEALTVLISTAYMDEAERCDQVYVLHKGRVLTSGTPASLRARAEGRCFRARPREGLTPRLVQARLAAAGDLVADAVPQGGTVRFILSSLSSPSSAGTLAAELARRCGAQPPEAVPARLEDGFMSLLQEEKQGGSGEVPPLPPESNVPPKYDSDRENIIEVRDLVRRFGDFIAVNKSSFSVRRGEVFGLLGPNGAGKTTTFRMLCGLLAASSGELRVAGVNLRKARAKAREHLGYVAQKFSLYGSLDVRQNLEFFGGVYGLRFRELKDRSAELMREFGLSDRADTPAKELPGGYQQRLAMACALLHRPAILFLDEPTSGIDVPARRSFWRRITALAAQGTTVVITTHFMEEAEYCDRILIQDAGRVLALGSPDEVRARAGQAETMEEAFIRIVRQARAEEA